MSPANWELANPVRLERARLRRQIGASHDYRTSRSALADVLGGDHPEINGMPVIKLLGWVYRMRDSDAVKLLHGVGASPFMDVRQLTTRQRLKLAFLLRAGPAELRQAEIDELARWSRQGPHA